MKRKLSHHDLLISEAQAALDELFSDRDVDAEVTYDDLVNLRTDIEFKMNSLLKIMHDE